MTAGIVCDNYKVKKFKKVLSEAGYLFTVHPMTDELAGHTSIKVQYEQKQFKDLKALIHKTEISFKQSN